MASQSLYRKWRSQTFTELIGQEHVVQTLRNAIVEDRVAHAYLFTGPRGVGKTSMARLLSKAVNCLNSDPQQRPCGTCAACVSIAEGASVDVIEMDAASHTSVEDAREIIERVQFRPADLRFKVYVIDEVHMLSTAAFNALLKTLEEPPDHAIFILATTEVHKIPATIMSRCQRFTFTRHTVSATAAHLRRIAAAEGLSLEEGVPEAIARSATGSMRDALGVLEQLASFTSGSIALTQVQSLLGMTSAAEVQALIAALISEDVGAALQAVNGVAEQGADVRQFTRDLVERLRNLMLLQASADRTMLDISDDELALMAEWSQQVSTAQLLHWIKIFSGLDFQLRTTPYGNLPLELAVVEALVTPVAVQAAPAGGPARAPAAARRPAPAAAPPPLRPRTETPPLRSVAPAPAAAPLPAVPVPVEAQAEPLAPPVEPAPPPEPEVVVPAEPAAPQDAPPAVNADAAPAAAEAPTAELLAQRVVSPAEAKAAAQAANADFSVLEQIEAIWQDVIRDVRPKSPTVQALLHSIRPLDVEGTTIVLLASSPFHKSGLEKPQNRKIVEDVLAKHLGATFAIRCTIESKDEARDLRGQIREARKDELVRAAMNIFEAHIVDIEPYDEQDT